MKSLPLLYEDNHLLAVEKPAGIPSQATPEGNLGVEDLLKTFLKERDHKPGNVFLHAVHRLDSSVSGILLFAKTSKALSRAHEMMRSHQMTKQYMGIIENGTQFHSGDILEDYLIHDDRKATKASSHNPAAKKATLTILDCIPYETHFLITLELITGRYHQIRCQLGARKAPIIGDTKYGSHIPYKQGQIMLHHSFLSFIHPTRKERIEVRSRPSWL